MMKISKNSTENQNGPGIILSTMHGARGREYDRVYINPDLAASPSRPGGPAAGESGVEADIANLSLCIVKTGVAIHADDTRQLISQPKSRILGSKRRL